MEKEIYHPLGNFITNKSLLLAINKQHRADLDEILKDSHEIVQEVKVVSSFVFQAFAIPCADES